MFLAAVALVASAPGSVWRFSREVYDLAVFKGSVLAASSGGVLVQGRDSHWSPYGAGSPAPVRKFLIRGDHLEVVDRAGSVFVLNAGVWIANGEREPMRDGGLPSPRVVFEGHTLTAPWGGRFFIDEHGATALPRDPAEGDYALLALGKTLLAGTPGGVYRYEDGQWSNTLPISECPTPRPQGYAGIGDAKLVGGIGGVFVSRHMKSQRWIQASKDPVRQILQTGADAWVLYGSGAVDKVDLRRQQLVYDVIGTGVRRPWTSCLAASQGAIFFGGQGGWAEKSAKGVAEHYFDEIDKDVVMAIAGSGGVRWIGTQKTGLLRFGRGPIKLWNPGNGLTDTWVTGLLHTPHGLYVATAGAGLFVLRGDDIRPIPSPTSRPRQLALYKGRVVVGGMDGAWIMDTGGWCRLPTNGEETTSIAAGSKLIICTVGGVYFL